MKHLLTAARQTAPHFPWRTLCRCAVSLLLTALRLKGGSGTMAFQSVPASVAALADLYEIRDWVNV